MIFSHMLARVLNLTPIHRDHVHILLGAHVALVLNVKRKFYFCFESFWVQHEACDGVVMSGSNTLIRGCPMITTVRKLSADFVVRRLRWLRLDCRSCSINTLH